MYSRFLFSLCFLVLLLSSCATCACAAPTLGIFTDGDFAVTVVTEYMPADIAGVRVGDVLLDIRPAKPEPGFSLTPIPFTDHERVNELIYYTPPQIGLRLPGSYCCPGSGMPLVMRVQRGDQVVEIEIVSGPWDGPIPLEEYQPQQLLSPLSPIGTPTPYPTPLPTPTPVPQGWLYF